MNLRAIAVILSSLIIAFLGIRILIKKESMDFDKSLFSKIFEVKDRNKNKFRIASGAFYLAVGVLIFLEQIVDLTENRIMIEVISYLMPIILLILLINALRFISLKN